MATRNSISNWLFQDLNWELEVARRKKRWKAKENEIRTGEVSWGGKPLEPNPKEVRRFGRHFLSPSPQVPFYLDAKETSQSTLLPQVGSGPTCFVMFFSCCGFVESTEEVQFVSLILHESIWGWQGLKETVENLRGSVDKWSFKESVNSVRVFSSPCTVPWAGQGL